MPVDLQCKSPSGNPTVGHITCPVCQGNLLRQRRRTVDRLRSLFGPVRRFRCDNFACQWEGNVSKRRADMIAAGTGESAPAPGRADRPTDRVPAAFVVPMVLVAVGMVFVIFVSTMEPTFWFDDSEQAAGPSLHESVPWRSADRTASR